MYKMILRLDVGSRAEDFTLANCKGGNIRLSDLSEKGIVFFTFYRGGFDPESISYLKALKDSYRDLRENGADVLAITPELPPKALNVALELALPFDVACDTDMGVAKMYDVYDQVMNWCWPAGFIVGKDGVIQYAFRGASPPNTPPVGYVAGKIEQLKKAGEQPRSAAKAA
jgi:peroxiredoxin